MKELDLDALLQPVSAESPSGDDLEYDADFLAMVQAAAGTPERRMGESLVPAEDPDWSSVRALALRLLARSKDLRSAVFLTRALMHTDGLVGLSQGLRLLSGLVAEFWDTLHPQLDPEDNLDPSIRLNALLALSEPDTMLRPLRATPLIRSRIFGAISYRDIAVAEGKAAAARDAQPLDGAAIAAAFQDCDPEELSVTALYATAAVAEVHVFGEALAAHVPSHLMPNLEPLTALLSAIQAFLQARLGERRPGSDADVHIGVDPVAERVGLPDSSPGGVRTQISSREDVVQALDRLCDYYLRFEPSSPVPLLLKRARRLVTGNFVDIVRDLAPDALPQIQKVCGIDDKS
ncbi:MAG: type VI secretion system protein TssA [Thiocapsa sp.]|uniref:type VI secretion system protein TssA n=1 Tax=Thiocapsa sp. TaxID=2024551 RepID=UPI001BCAD5D0|nr:type VI secretion system protein TssA [Thiocapsa sp.]QVL49137.1 MAG: type VI secretion system protein TssA [Thiocapsa sp.]